MSTDGAARTAAVEPPDVSGPTKTTDPERPAWVEGTTDIWCEDDASRAARDDTRMRRDVKFRQLFGVDEPARGSAIAEHDGGDCVWWLFPGGVICGHSYAGEFIALTSETEALVERLAALEHEQWGHWTGYMLDRLTPITDAAEESWQTGAHIEVPPTARAARRDVDRWRGQVVTPYADLSKLEQRSDREWACRVVGLLWLGADSTGVRAQEPDAVEDPFGG